MAPVFASRFIKKFNTPIDFGKKINGKPIFGKNKTYKGLIFGTFVGIFISFIQFLLFKLDVFREISFLNYTFKNFYIIGFLLGFGALFGDLVESFFKRRVGIKPGKSWVPFDQIDYVLGAIIFLLPIYEVSLKMFLTILIISFFLHIIANQIGYYLKLEKTRW